MSEWVSYCFFTANDKFSALSCREQAILDEMMIPALHQTNTSSLILIVLVHWNKPVGRHGAPLGHIILIARQAVFDKGNNKITELLNDALLVEKQQFRFNSVWFVGGSNPRSTALATRAVTNIRPMCFYSKLNVLAVHIIIKQKWYR